MPDSPQGRPKLGEILLRRKVIDAAQLEKGLQAQGATMLPLGSTLIRLGIADEIAVALALAEQWGVPGLHLSASVIATDVSSVVPEDVARSHRVLPLQFHGQSLHLGLASPSDQALLDEVAFACGSAALPFVAPRVVLDDAIAAVYAAKNAQQPVWVGSRAGGTDPYIEVLQVPKAAVEKPAPVSVEPELTAGVLEQFPAMPAPQPRAERGMVRVLAVDDEPEILDIIEKALTHRKMEVVRATRGRQALELLQATRPDIVLLDAMLPEIHGFEICSHIKKSPQFKHIPVIMISAIYTGWNLVQDVKRIYGADEYVTKPFRIVELVRRVEDLLSKAQQRPPPAEVTEAHQEAERELKRAAELFVSGQLGQSIEAARRAVMADPLDARAHFTLGTALHRAGALYEAISEYERVVELAPTQFNALKNLAVLYERQGFKKKAVELWMRALECSPNAAVRQTIKAHLIDLL